MVGSFRFSPRQSLSTLFTCRHVCRSPTLHEVDEDLLPLEGRLQARIARGVVPQQERDGERRRLCKVEN